MKLKIQIEDQELTIDVGLGLNDLCWLALTACKMYGKLNYPAGNYLPAILKTKAIQPHPRQQIMKFVSDYTTAVESRLKDGTYKDISDAMGIKVEILKPHMKQEQEYKEWFDKAFGCKRNVTTCSFDFRQHNKLVKDQNYFVRFNYSIHKDVQFEFNKQDYDKTYHLFLREKISLQSIGEDSEYSLSQFYAEIDLPYGKVVDKCQLLRGQIVVNERGGLQPYTKDQSYTLPYLIPGLDVAHLQPFTIADNNPMEYLTEAQNPEPTDPVALQQKIKEAIKIPEQLQDKLLQQEAEIKKEQNTGNLCPFEFNTLWQMLENKASMKDLFETLEQNIKDKIQNILSENLNKLYEIFFQYSMLYIQKTDQKDHIAIPFQDIMHFIKFYQILEDSNQLFSFCSLYDKEEKRCSHDSPKYTLDLGVGVQFPEFIEILIEATNFSMTENLMSNNHSIDMQLEKIVNVIMQIEQNDDDFNEFHKHMKFNITLMNFLRENSETLQQIFLEKLMESNLENKKFHLLTEQIKSLIQDAGFKGDNLGEIVNTCIQQLSSEEKQQNFEGTFYYDFLQVMQWLSLVLITDTEEEEEKQQEDENEEGVEALIEKLRFFLMQFK